VPAPEVEPATRGRAERAAHPQVESADPDAEEAPSRQAPARLLGKRSQDERVHAQALGAPGQKVHRPRFRIHRKHLGVPDQGCVVGARGVEAGEGALEPAPCRQGPLRGLEPLQCRPHFISGDHLDLAASRSAGEAVDGQDLRPAPRRGLRGQLDVEQHVEVGHREAIGARLLQPGGERKHPHHLIEIV
jgi:hypothetical protein